MDILAGTINAQGKDIQRSAVVKRWVIRSLLLKIVNVLIWTAPLVIIIHVLMNGGGWPDYRLSLFYVTAILLSFFLNKGVDRQAVFVLLWLIFPLYSPLYCKLMDGDTYSLNNQWLQFQEGANEYAIAYVVLAIYLLWLLFKVYGNKQYVYSEGLLPLRNAGLVVYLISTVLFFVFFYVAEPGQTLLAVNYSELMDQRIEGAQFSGGLGGIFFVLSALVYLSARETGIKKWVFANNFFIVLAILSVAWLLLHARRTELVGMAGIYMLWLDRNVFRKAVIAILGLMLLIGVGIVRDEVVTAASVALAFGDTALTKNVALPGGASNVYLTLLNGMHAVGNYGVSLGVTIVENSIAIVPTFILEIIDVKPYYFSDFFVDKYDYNGGAYFPVVFYLNFSIFGLILLAAFLFFMLKQIRQGAVSSRLSTKLMAGTLVFFSAKLFWYEPIGSLKFALYAYFIGLVIEKAAFQGTSNNPRFSVNPAIKR